MSWTFLCDVAVDLLGGAGAGLLILWVAEKVFGIRKEAERRRQERRADAQRASTYLQLLRAEVEAIGRWIPSQVSRVQSTEWGMAVPIATPVWDVVQQTGELVSLVNPEVLQRTAIFYEELAYAKQILDFLQLSWLVPEEGVADIKKKRLEMRDAVAGTLNSAERSAATLLSSLGSEIAGLGERLEGIGQV